MKKTILISCAVFFMAAGQAIGDGEWTPDSSKAEVVLTYGQTKLIYIIDMQADVVEKITFVSETGELIGQLNFSYLQEVENIGNEFTSPRKEDSAKPRGIQWLLELIRLK